MRQTSIRSRVVGVLVPLALAVSPVAPADPGPDFTAQVLPVLASKCFACHGPDSSARKAELRLDLQAGIFGKTREGIPVVGPGDPDNSELWWRVGEADAKDRMPPAEFPKSLTPEEIELLRRWIENGARWEGHWAFTPLSRPQPPRAKNAAGPRNPIDAFIAAKLDTLGLAPSDEADRRTLVRRLYFDLHGLPPTPEEMEAFLQDTAPQAYEGLVDRLLASPRYGERWGRHWLDVAHYADTHGYDKDKRRPHAWPYRDYVIEALNEDKPYGRFIEEQLAGDVLYPGDPRAMVATGFIAAGPWDFVGHVELREGTVDKKITRLLDRDDMLTTVMTVFTGLTVQCARCHDHKFDPISQADYYALQAVFAGVERADRVFDADPAVHRERTALAARKKSLQMELRPWHARLDAMASPEIDLVNQKTASLRQEIKILQGDESPSNGYHSLVSPDDRAVKWVQVDLGGPQLIDAVHLHPARPTDFPDTPGFGFPQQFKVEASQSPDFTSPIPLLDRSHSGRPDRTDQPLRIDTPGLRARYVRVTATQLWERRDDYVFALAELEVFAAGKNLALGAAVTAADSIDEGRWHTRFLTDGFDSRRRLDSAVEGEGPARERARLESEVKALRAEDGELRRRTLARKERRTLETLESRLAETEAALAKLPKPAEVFAAATDFEPNGAFTPPGGVREIRVLKRGDVRQEGELAAPGAVTCIPGLPSRFELPEGAGEGERRAALAKWITSESNPLTWRSIVNRVWHHHFGLGIVETPNDFGRMGSPPTHRELLDWLASEFLAHGQSLKALHRLIVTSATYRQASTHNAAAAKIDSSNRFLWRMNRRQLDAEALRDTVLYVGGSLDFTRGGPGFENFVFEDDHSPRFLYERWDASDPSSRRRSVYRFIVRSVPEPFMTSLDCADPSQSVPVRTQTITAIQALALLNNPLVVEQAAALAGRVSATSDSVEARLAEAYRLALGRAPAAAELEALVPYTQSHGLPAACRLLFNSNEFTFVD